MGGRHLRSISSGGIAAILCATMVAAPVAVHATDDCYGVDVQQPFLEPPLEQPAAFVTVIWDNTRDYVFSYDVTTSPDPLNDPTEGENASWAGGCQPPSALCNRADPLVITEASLSWQDADGSSRGYHNNAVGAGTYTVLAETKGFCYFPDGSPEGMFYDDASGTFLQPNMVAPPKTVPVTATIEAFDEQGRKVFEDQFTAMVPIKAYPQSEPSDRRILGTFTWDPTVGISNVTSAGAAAVDAVTAPIAEVAPPPPGVAAAAPPASYDDPTSAEPGDSTAPGVSEADAGSDLVRALRDAMKRALEAGGATVTAGEGRPVNALALLLALVVLDVGRSDDGVDDAAEVAALFLRVVLGLTNEVKGTTVDAPDNSASAEAPAPKKPNPPKLTGKAKRRFEKQGREWVWLPAPVVIKVNYPEVAERTLKAGVWYQMKEHEEGDREFFTKKGSRIGTSLSEDRGTFRVRRWEGAEEAGE